ncbi:helix-turn-helix domain-containing protein [Achromobacter agilis]|uniref:Transcriptional activator NphR n=1 Tax=Achromobacter agilis TaxID=1353888 RepID=A0A446CEF4_9BURK|nr:helix-turn-helix domain-containing protein [Achromobacter agilis]SSW66193.1 Transcriptional activator NphR [Achromobacter agilis]
MQLVFDAQQHALPLRRDMWQDALCSAYIALDAEMPDSNDYCGVLRKGNFGPVSITDISLAGHVIRRRKQHLARLDKDCFYLQILQRGHARLNQDRREVPSNQAVAALFYSGEPYDLECLNEIRALYLEIPRATLKSKLSGQDAPIAGNVGIGSGIGKLAAQLCVSLTTESGAIDAADKARLGEDLLNIVALAVDRAANQSPDPDTHQVARLRLIQAWIEMHLSAAGLSLETIAKQHGISVRLLHHLFHQDGISPADWMWDRRLQRCFDEITAKRDAQRTITEIAYANGFSSSSHFSNAFKAKFGVSPRDARRT